MEIRNSAFDPARQPLPLDITRPNRETIERGTPEPTTPEDVRTRMAQQKQLQAERAQNAREKLKAQRIEAARRPVLGNDEVERAQAADQVDPGAERPSSAERALAARGAMLADRAQNAREVARASSAREALVQQRVESARDKVSLSETSLRLRAQAARADHQPSDEARADNVARLRDLHRQGVLNTEELIARAAFNMLSGE